MNNKQADGKIQIAYNILVSVNPNNRRPFVVCLFKIKQNNNKICSETNTKSDHSNNNNRIAINKSNHENNLFGCDYSDR